MREWPQLDPSHSDPREWGGEKHWLLGKLDAGSKHAQVAADGTIVSNATPTLEVAKVSDAVTGIFEVITPEASGNSNLDNLFRYDPTSGQYIYNLSSKGYTTGTYVLRAHLNDGTDHGVYVSVR